MCVSCDRLRAELREVKEELAEWKMREDDSVDGDIALISRTLKLPPQPARIVNELMSAASRVVTSEKLIESMDYGGRGGDKGRWTAEGNAMKVCLSMARKGLREAGLHDAISTVWREGYIMPKSKAVELRAILDAA